jgi:hypothetical protein
MWTSKYYNYWDNWNLYHKVTFDGVNKQILINYGQTSIDIGDDIYSPWKEWSLLYDYMKFPQAFTAIGGESIGGSEYVGTTYFLENGWRIKPWEGDHNLTITGNIYTRESGENPYLNTAGRWKINITNKVSTIVRTIETSGNNSTGSFPTVDEIATAVWNKQIPTSPATGSYGEWVGGRLLTLAHYLGLK